MKKLIITAAFLPLTALAGTIPVVITESTTVPPVVVPPTPGAGPGSAAGGAPPPAVVQQVNSAIQTFTPQTLANIPAAQLQQILSLIDNVLPAADAGAAGGISPQGLRALRSRVRAALDNA
jgi:hypothetical protein